MAKKYTYSESNITAKVQDGDYLWIAFNGVSGISTLYKVSIYNPNIIYFNVDINVDKINRMKFKNNYIYCSVDSTSYIGVKIYSLNPFKTDAITYISKESSINENSIDIITGTSEIFFLLPGTLSGEIASLQKYDYTLTFLEEIKLDASSKIINNARTMTLDSNENIWIATHEEDIRLVKVFLESGGSYNYEVYNIE